MMTAFINKVTGTVMYVHESRVDEYLAAGHKLAASAFDTPVDENKAELMKEPKKRRKKAV